MTSSRQINPLPRLLPREEPLGWLQPYPRDAVGSPIDRPRRRAVIAACDSCRRLKAKCDAQRPVCSACAANSRECKYPTEESETRGTALKRKYSQIEQQVRELRDANATLSQLVQAIQSRDDADAAAIFQKLRRGADPRSLLQNIEVGDVILQLKVTPETRYRFEVPYKSEMPASLLGPRNPYLGSVLYEAAFMINNSTPVASDSLRNHSKAQYLKPYSAAKLVDSRLDSIKPSKWTNVSDNDELMRVLFRLYFIHEYPWFPAFHMDHFLDDMLSGSTMFCSSLLVNAILAYAYHCHLDMADRSEYWNPQMLGYLFFAEAKRLLEMEQMQKKTLTTLQATFIINVIYNFDSMDILGMTYTVQAVAMAEELDIFGPLTSVKSERRRQSYSFTAWCLYFWTSIQCYYFMIPPLIKSPPKASLPNPDQNREWYPELWLQYPDARTLCPTNFGYLFVAKSRLIDILNRITFKFFKKDAKSVNPKSVTIANFIANLQKWHSSLPRCLGPSEVVYPPQLKLHLLYHNALINLSELLANPETVLADAGRLKPLELLSDSKKSYETILRLYYLRHGFENADVYMAHGLNLLANMALARIKSALKSDSQELDDARSTLFLAAKGLHDQGKNYYLTYVLFRVVVQGMDPGDVNILKTFLSLRRGDSEADQLRTQHVHAQYPVNVARLVDNPESQRLCNVIKPFSEMELEDRSVG